MLTGCPPCWLETPALWVDAVMGRPLHRVHRVLQRGGDVAIPALRDPDERITRIRFFTRKLRSRDGILVDDLGCRQRVSRGHGPEA